MTTTSFSTATPSSRRLRSQQQSPPLSYRHLVRIIFFGTAFVFYSFRQNIFDFLLTFSLRARQSVNQMSESQQSELITRSPSHLRSIQPSLQQGGGDTRRRPLSTDPTTFRATCLAEQ